MLQAQMIAWKSRAHGPARPVHMRVSTVARKLGDKYVYSVRWQSKSARREIVGGINRYSRHRKDISGRGMKSRIFSAIDRDRGRARAEIELIALETRRCRQ